MSQGFRNWLYRLAGRLGNRNIMVYEHPFWMASFKKQHQNKILKTPESMMKIANGLAAKNVSEKTGGPFGSIIVNLTTGKIAGMGVNRVVTESCIFHGETSAIYDAQRNLGVFNLGGEGMDPHVLVTSAAPCAMCAGAIVWSGVSQVVTGAQKEDVESIVGFDEGPVHPNLVEEYKKRGISMIEAVSQEACRQVLQDYIDGEGTVYNGERNG